jgi:hypothetical protein
MPFKRTATVRCPLPSSNSCSSFRGADQTACQRPRLDATVFIELAEMRNSLLNDTTTDTHAAHKAPVAVNLAVLP